MTDDDRDDDVLFRDDNDDGDDLPSYYSSPANTEQLVYHELQPASSCQAPSEEYVGPTSTDQELLDALDDTIVQYTITAVNHRAQATCVGCEINHPSQVQHMAGCLADYCDKTIKHLPDVLDAALPLIFAKWATSTWREEIKEKVLGEQKPTEQWDSYYHSDDAMYG